MDLYPSCVCVSVREAYLSLIQKTHFCCYYSIVAYEPSHRSLPEPNNHCVSLFFFQTNCSCWQERLVGNISPWLSSVHFPLIGRALFSPLVCHSHAPQWVVQCPRTDNFYHKCFIDWSSTCIYCISAYSQSGTKSSDMKATKSYWRKKRMR